MNTDQLSDESSPIYKLQMISPSSRTPMRSWRTKEFISIPIGGPIWFVDVTGTTVVITLEVVQKYIWHITKEKSPNKTVSVQPSQLLTE